VASRDKSDPAPAGVVSRDKSDAVPPGGDDAVFAVDVLSFVTLEFLESSAFPPALQATNATSAASAPVRL